MLPDPSSEFDVGPADDASLDDEPVAADAVAAESPPPIANVRKDDFRQVDPRNVRVEVLTGLVFCAFASTGLAITTSVLTVSLDWSSVATAWITAAAGLFLITLLVFSLRWPAVEHRHTCYRVDDRRIEIRRGVIWRTAISIPRNRIQHTDVAQGPIQRRFDLATLVIHTAGTHNYEVRLAGLARDTAVAVRERLLVEREADAV